MEFAKNFAIGFAMAVGIWMVLGLSFTLMLNYSIVPWLELNPLSLGQGMLALLSVMTVGFIWRFTQPRPKTINFNLPAIQTKSKTQ